MKHSMIDMYTIHNCSLESLKAQNKWAMENPELHRRKLEVQRKLREEQELKEVREVRGYF